MTFPGPTPSSVNPDGWISMDGPEGAGVHVRVRDRDGQLVISDLYLHAEEITPAVMRALSISRLQAGVNALRWDESEPESSVGEVAAACTEWSRLSGRPDPTLAELRARLPIVEQSPYSVPRSRLTRPDGADPDRFYSLVALAYYEYAPQTRAPAKEIATEAGVPIGTAHGWIREARRRGFLPAAMKGKAG